MEQTEYWMWTKQQHNPYYIDLSSYIFPSSSRTSRRHHLLPCSTRGGDYSWEEQAFAEDAASSGGLGGCIWPPRSYSCTFCNKDFMSAQALGGHMNVHRRDRARLKQSQAHNNQGNILEAQTSCNFSLNPFLEFVNQDVATTTTSSAIRVSSSSRLDYSNNNETQYLFPYVQEESTIFHQKSGLNHSERQAHLSTSSRAKGENFAKPDLSISQNPREGQGPTMTARPNKRNFVKADLSISLNLVICSSNNNNNHSCASDDDEDEDGRCKIRRIDPASALNLFNIEQDDEQRTMNHTVSCIDDIDLELRLGGSAKVK